MARPVLGHLSGMYGDSAKRRICGLGSLWRDEAGATLIELSIAVCAVALASFGAWKVFEGTSESTLSDMAQEVGAIHTGARVGHVPGGATKHRDRGEAAGRASAALSRPDPGRNGAGRSLPPSATPSTAPGATAALATTPTSSSDEGGSFLARAWDTTVDTWNGFWSGAIKGTVGNDDPSYSELAGDTIGGFFTNKLTSPRDVSFATANVFDGQEGAVTEWFLVVGSIAFPFDSIVKAGKKLFSKGAKGADDAHVEASGTGRGGDGDAAEAQVDGDGTRSGIEGTARSVELERARLSETLGLGELRLLDDGGAFMRVYETPDGQQVVKVVRESTSGFNNEVVHLTEAQRAQIARQVVGESEELRRMDFGVAESRVHDVDPTIIVQDRAGTSLAELGESGTPSDVRRAEVEMETLIDDARRETDYLIDDSRDNFRFVRDAEGDVETVWIDPVLPSPPDP